MEAEVIDDLTESPPSSPKEPHKPSRILKFTAYIYSKKIIFKVKKSCMPSFTFNPNPNSANLGTSLFSQATHQLVDKEDPWSLLTMKFLMELMNYGGGRWNKIAKKFVKNKTARQVERHAISFFINFLETYLPSSTAAIASASDITALNPNPHNNNKMNKGGEREGGMGPPRTLILFSNGEASSSNEISEMNTTRTSVAADDDNDDEVDLELRLGRSNRYKERF